MTKEEDGVGRLERTASEVVVLGLETGVVCTTYFDFGLVISTIATFARVDLFQSSQLLLVVF